MFNIKWYVQATPSWFLCTKQMRRCHIYIYIYMCVCVYSPFNHASGHGLSFGSGLLVRAIHAGHVLLPELSPAQ